MGKRLQNINVENSEANRRAYRELLFSAGPELSKHISGVILYHETLYQKASNGQPLVNLLRSNGIIAGIKVDTGTVPLAGSDGECTTQGRVNILMDFLIFLLCMPHFTCSLRHALSHT
jgi:fructose-bisphosphate aldolase class I